MQLLVLLFCLINVFSIPPPWPFSWNTISTWCLPGIDTFFDDAHLHHFIKYDMIAIWGMNASCANTPNTTHCYHQPCHCGDEGWAPNQDIKTRMQAAMFKKLRHDVRIFGYNRVDVSQLWYPFEADFNDPKYKHLWLKSNTDDTIVNCTDKCNYEGPAAVAYDFSNQEARDYFIQKVISWSLEPEMDGLFFDECDDIVSHGVAKRFGVPKEQSDAVLNGTLLMLEDLLKVYQIHDRVAILSAEARLDFLPHFYNTYIDLISKYGGFRYYEFYCQTKSEWKLCRKQIITLMHESSIGIPVQAHVPLEKDTDINVALATFLVAAGEYSYFSISNGWGKDSFPWLPQYDYPLGAPQGTATINGNIFNRSFANASVYLDVEHWIANITWFAPPPRNCSNATAVKNINAIYGSVPNPGISTSSVKFLGLFDTLEKCKDIFLTYPLATSYSYVTTKFDDTSWRKGCYARVDGVYLPKKQIGIVSGKCILDK